MNSKSVPFLSADELADLRVLLKLTLQGIGIKDSLFGEKYINAAEKFLLETSGY